MDDKVNLAEKLELLDRPYSPGIVGFLNDYKLAVVKVHGEFVWHKHDDTDDFFLVLRGRLTIQLRDRDVELSQGEGDGQHRRRGRGAHGRRGRDLTRLQRDRVPACRSPATTCRATC